MWLRAARLSETGVASAGQRGGSVETAIAFAGENRVFLVRFLVAEVLSVSASPPHCVLCAKKFAQHSLIVGVSAK